MENNDQPKWENNQNFQSYQNHVISPIPNPKGARFASAALVFGILSTTCGVFLFWTPFVIIGFIGGGLAILFANLSKGNKKIMEKRAKTGFIFGIIGPILSTLILTFTIGSSIYILRTNPELQESNRQMIREYEEDLENYYGEDFMAQYEDTYGKKFDLEGIFDQIIGE